MPEDFKQDCKQKNILALGKLIVGLYIVFVCASHSAVMSTGLPGFAFHTLISFLIWFTVGLVLLVGIVDHSIKEFSVKLNDDVRFRLIDSSVNTISNDGGAAGSRWVGGSDNILKSIFILQ